MPTFRVTGPDGKTYQVTAPEGATQDQVLARVKAHSGGAMDKPTSFMQGVNESLSQVNKNLNAINPVNAAMRALGVTPQTEKLSGKIDRKLAASPYRGSTAGKITGGVIGTLPTAMLPGGPLVQGALSGGLLTDKKDAQGVLTDMAVGAVSSKLGDKAARGIARVVSPKVAPVVQRLKDYGVLMTPGQILGATNSKVGGMLKGVEDRLTGVPFLGDVVTGARRRSVETFNRAALNQSLKPIGKSLPKGGPIGNEGIAKVERELGKAYDEVLPKLNAVGDTRFADDLVKIHAKAKTMAPDRAKQFDAILNDLGRFWKPGNSITGKDLKAIESRLGERIRNYGSGADPDARDLANILGEVQSSLRSMAARQNPSQAAKLKAINAGWAQFTRLQKAASSATKDGVFTPNQLSVAARVMDKSGRKAATARGDALMQRFAQDAQSVLPSSVPDSGTAGRLMMGLGVGGYFNPATAAAGGAAMLPYTKGGQKAFEWLLTGRQGPVAKSIADYIRLTAPVASGGAASLAIQKP